jgi:hypothetical protein
LDTENHSKALFDTNNLEEDTTPPNPSPPLCALQQMMQKPSNWWNNSHYMLTISLLEAFCGSFILKQPYLVYCDCIVTDGHMLTSKVHITVATRFKSGDCIQAEHYNLGALSKCLLISQYTVMDTSTNMTPPSTTLSKLEFVKYNGREKHEHAMLCHALQTILEGAFHPMQKK